MGMIINPFSVVPAGGTAYQYHRLYITALCGHTQAALQELQIYEVIAGTNVALSGTATASSDGFGWIPSHINDGDTTGGGAVGWHATGGVPQWIMIDFGGSPKSVAEFRVFSAPGREDQAPSAFEYQASNNSGGPWTTLKSVSGLVGGDWSPSPNNYRIYSVP